jgi:hypothetical protein
MSVAEIKEIKSNLISWIEDLDDINTLSLIESVKNSQTKHDWWDDLPKSHKQNIQEGLDDIKNGRVMTSDEFWKSLKND